MAKYALLFSGGMNEDENKPCYNNDLGFAYQVLTQKRGYLTEHIEVLYADGREISYQGIDISANAASKANFFNLMSRYRDIVNPDDTFLLVVSNHGGSDGKIYTWNNEYLEMKEVIHALTKISCPKIILLGQCFGGNYTEDHVHIPNAIIISANKPGEKSYIKSIRLPNSRIGMDTQNAYTEFFYHFFSYYNGCYPCGKSLNVGVVGNTISSAYTYAKKNDFFASGVGIPCEAQLGKYTRIKDKVLLETPCFKDTLRRQISL